MARVRVLVFNVVALPGLDGYEPGELLGSTDQLSEALKLRRDRDGRVVGRIVQERRLVGERITAGWGDVE